MRFRPLVAWPYEETRPRRGPFTFRASWSNTLEVLGRELGSLKAENVVIQADFTESDIRLDGMPRSGAKTPAHPGIILSFESKHGPLQYATDAHQFWQHNVRAIGLGLEALRSVDRYGITKTGEQYTGWRQLTAGSGVTSRSNAVRTIAVSAGRDVDYIEHLANTDDPELERVYRLAMKATHPDAGGSSDLFAAVRDAGRVLEVAS